MAKNFCVVRGIMPVFGKKFDINNPETWVANEVCAVFETYADAEHFVEHPEDYTGTHYCCGRSYHIIESHVQPTRREARHA